MHADREEMGRWQCNDCGPRAIDTWNETVFSHKKLCAVCYSELEMSDMFMPVLPTPRETLDETWPQW